MKVKKALKRLAKVDGLLADVKDRYSASDHVVHGLLDTARTSLASAREKLDAAASEASSKKPPARSAKGRAAKARATAVKRKPNGAAAARALSRTA